MCSSDLVMLSRLSLAEYRRKISFIILKNIMADIFNKEKRSLIMSRIAGKDTKPEMIIRKALFSEGYRYRLHRKDLPGNPDIVFPNHKKVIFINGCFWHGHNCKKAALPTTNKSFWKKKDRKSVV